MAILEIPYRKNGFNINISVSKIGGSEQKKTIPAIIDTGASQTCVSFNLVNELKIAPSGPHTLTTTANGKVFSKKYPLQLKINKDITCILPTMVNFSPTLLFDVPTSKDTFSKLDLKQQLVLIKTFCKLQGKFLPDHILYKFVDDVITVIKIFGP